MGDQTMSAQFRNFLSQATRFARHDKGSFATTFGLSAVAAMLCAGIAVDYVRMSNTRTVVTDALDAAVLAAARDLAQGTKSESELRSDFDAFFQANIEQRLHQADGVRIVGFETDEGTGTVSAEAQADLKMAFMGLAGKHMATIGSASEAKFSTDAVEIAMTLDVTGSMSGSKIRELREAASSAIDILLPANNAGDRLRIGLIPYAQAVNAGEYAEPASGSRNGCVSERVGVNAYNDAGYNGANGQVGALETGCPTYAVLPLTSDRRELIGEISRYRAGGKTAGHIGIAWSYYMLSQNWRNLWPRDGMPRNYDDKVQKIAIVMTDGLFNKYYDGIANPDSEKEKMKARSAATALALCTDMKRDKGAADGITVYTIAFELDGKAANAQDARDERDALALMEECATPPSGGNRYFFDARNGEELKRAFEQIAFDIQKLRLSR